MLVDEDVKSAQAPDFFVERFFDQVRGVEQPLLVVRMVVRLQMGDEAPAVLLLWVLLVLLEVVPVGVHLVVVAAFERGGHVVLLLGMMGGAHHIPAPAPAAAVRARVAGVGVGRMLLRPVLEHQVVHLLVGHAGLGRDRRDDAGVGGGMMRVRAACDATVHPSTA